MSHTPMDIDSNDWQVMGDCVYRLFTDSEGDRCNKFTIQFSINREVDIREKETLAKRVAALLNAAS